MHEEIDWEYAVALCDDVLELIDDLPERAEEFAEGVREKVASIKETIKLSERVSPAQVNAIRNMEAGIRKWLDH